MTFQSAPVWGNLRAALAISSLCHVLLLWPGPPALRGENVAMPLVATLRTAAAPAAAPAPQKSPLPAQPEPEDNFPRRATPIVGSELSSSATANSTVEAPLRSGVSPAQATGIDGNGARPTPAGVAPAAAGGADADGVRQYRVALSLQARRFKRYPARALDANVGGIVEIRVAVAAGGRAEEVRLARSSGDESLDDAALDMITKAAARTAVPELLRGRAFIVSLPVMFDLADE